MTHHHRPEPGTEHTEMVRLRPAQNGVRFAVVQRATCVTCGKRIQRVPALPDRMEYWRVAA